MAPEPFRWPSEEPPKDDVATARIKFHEPLRDSLIIRGGEMEAFAPFLKPRHVVPTVVIDLERNSAAFGTQVYLQLENRRTKERKEIAEVLDANTTKEIMLSLDPQDARLLIAAVAWEFELACRDAEPNVPVFINNDIANGWLLEEDHVLKKIARSLKEDVQFLCHNLQKEINGNGDISLHKAS